ncbi:MAG: aspartate--ammonia ligase [Planctomycetia bacterium]|nr:aspartate--ammonia ligase [Planctomycetia bacterium]MDO5113581.1 aspartate--ammonia ligase [Planctomycetia bacterium]
MTIPTGYKPLLSVRDCERAIKQVKDHFEEQLSQNLGLQRVTAPFFVRSGTGLNDDLNGIEKPVSFCVKGAGCDVEVVQSLAKWKRYALKRYGFQPGEGLYTDMNAIRKDETLDEIHSFYVDQWDWCKVILPEERTLEMLRETVKKIYACIAETEKFVVSQHPALTPILPEKITFVTTKELYETYPDKTPKERETEACRKYGAIFVVGIGGELPDGSIHDGRAPDYDDWTTPREDGGMGLNGDILVWNPVLQSAFELSSMGIRVDAEALRRQLKIRGCEERAKLPFHQMLLAGQLPQTMGGGIGQSRLCMYMLHAAHIGEVACGIWPDEMREEYEAAGVTLL